MKINLRSCAAFAAIPLLFLAGAGRAHAAITVVTPGEQNTQSGENGCKATPCGGGTWLHYPELLQVALGNGYVVKNNGDGGAVLGCDTTTATVAGNNSFCKSQQYTSSIATQPGIVIIGPFGEHDQRIVGANGNVASLYKQSVFEAAYEGLVQKYLKAGTTIYMMTPIDVPWGGTPDLPAGDDLVKDIMLPAALKVAMNHSITVIDAYTAISSTPTLVTQYYGSDGQVKASGQQKMADLILAALMGGGAGGAGGAGGTGGAGGAGGATQDAGAGDAAGGASGAGGATGGTAGAAGTAGATTGTAGVNGSGAGGSTSTTAGTAGSTGGAAGTSGSSPGAAGTAGASSGAAGTSVPGGGYGNGGSSSGCAVASTNKGGPLGLAVAAMLAALVIGRRRARRR